MWKKNGEVGDTPMSFPFGEFQIMFGLTASSWKSRKISFAGAAHIASTSGQKYKCYD